MIGKAVLEKTFEYYGNIHVYCHGMRADHPLGSKYFQNHKSSAHLSISFKFFSSNDNLTIFPIQMHGRPMLTLPSNMSWSSQVHDLYYLCRPILPDASCQVFNSYAFWLWRRFLKVFAIYSHGGHLGHVTWTIYINFRSPFKRMLHM